MADEREIRNRERTRSYRPGALSGVTPYRGSTGRGAGALTRQSTTSPMYGIAGPYSMMRRFADEVDRVFRDFGLGGGSLLGSDLWTESLGEAVFNPQIETFRRGNELVIRADLPGIEKDKVNVEFEEDHLTISGERENEYHEESDDFYRSERSYGSFYRAIPLPEGVDEKKIHANFKDGVLEVSMPAPKESEHQRKRIDVK